MAILRVKGIEAAWSTNWTAMRLKHSSRSRRDVEVHPVEDTMNEDALLGTSKRTEQSDSRSSAVSDIAVKSKEAPTILERSLTERWSLKKASVDWSFQQADQDYISGIDGHHLRIYASTWNVGGKSPGSDLNLEEVLQMSTPSDIYVLGFQEIVPLNAANVMGPKASGPAAKWVRLIDETLNGCHTAWSPSLSSSSNDSDAHPETLSAHHKLPNTKTLKTCKFGEENGSKIKRASRSAPFSSSPRRSFAGEGDLVSEQKKYSMIVCKQMVGIFLTLWVRTRFIPHVSHLKVRSVGRGLLGYLRNKGCVSVSMCLYNTSFCFMCCHLASGQKEGDELRRNYDVLQILRSTYFSSPKSSKRKKSPVTVLDHDRVIWLGDMNYRISLSYGETKKLVENNDWEALLEKDQLRTEQRAGRIFKDWHEGKIYFAPTYKYAFNSDQYVGATEKPKGKRRTPAWCDRILWYGNGLKQLSYVRGESRFSDHRPVYAIFIAEMKRPKMTKLKRSNTR